MMTTILIATVAGGAPVPVMVERRNYITASPSSTEYVLEGWHRRALFQDATVGFLLEEHISEPVDLRDAPANAADILAWGDTLPRAGGDEEMIDELF